MENCFFRYGPRQVGTASRESICPGFEYQSVEYGNAGESWVVQSTLWNQLSQAQRRRIVAVYPRGSRLSSGITRPKANMADQQSVVDTSPSKTAVGESVMQPNVYVRVRS